MPKITNIMETAIKTMTQLNDGKKEPVHAGEAMACWLLDTHADGGIAYMQVAMNTTKDKELLALTKEIYDFVLYLKEKLESFMTSENIQISDGFTNRGAANPDQIPNGAKQTDTEICNTIEINVIASFLECAADIAQSLRIDLQMILFEFMTSSLMLAQKLAVLSKKRGWLRTPPLFNQGT